MSPVCAQLRYARSVLSECRITVIDRDVLAQYLGHQRVS